MTLSQKQSNVILSVKPTVIYNPDVYRKWTSFFFSFFSFEETAVPSLSLCLDGMFGSFRQTLFMTYLRTGVDSE